MKFAPFKFGRVRRRPPRTRVPEFGEVARETGQEVAGDRSLRRPPWAGSRPGMRELAIEFA